MNTGYLADSERKPDSRLLVSSAKRSCSKRWVLRFTLMPETSGFDGVFLEEVKYK